MINNLAINTNTYHGFTLENAVQGASEAGFKQIELAGAKDHTNHVHPNMTKEQISEIKSLLHHYGMNCVGIGAHSNVMEEAGIAYLLASIDLAVAFDCPYIVTATGDSHGDTDIVEDESLLAEKLAPVLDKCEKLNKTLLIETHGNNYATGKAVKKLAKSLNDRVKINYDTGNVIFYGNTLPYDDLAQSIDYIEFIHLKDKLGVYNEWNFPAIGDGDIDFHKIFTILEEGKYKGPISVEIEFTPSGPNDLEEVNHFVKRSFNYLSTILD
ncbi:sugar phosphate isomerase/epimerase family protein [Pseudogracilibacillus sp. SE30717A]|uniref:sugar phosphate isomerase/epimerase family protein n=1 Tax=Pseudogracilibacillus sp. SE30717A TaxID=3098293 RepID=UPI00300E150D